MKKGSCRMRCDQCIDKVDAKDEECVVGIEVKNRNNGCQCVEVDVVGEKRKTPAL